MNLVIHLTTEAVKLGHKKHPQTEWLATEPRTGRSFRGRSKAEAFGGLLLLLAKGGEFQTAGLVEVHDVPPLTPEEFRRFRALLNGGTEPTEGASP